MDLMDAIAQRHSVRTYLPDPLSASELAALQDWVAEANQVPGLSFKLAVDEPEAFSGFFTAHYGTFSGVRNYLVCAGQKGPDLAEDVGHAGELIVLRAQAMGLNSCWVGGTYSSTKVRKLFVPDDEQLVCVVALGHGAGEGKTHRVKPLEKLCTIEGASAPAWFEEGMWAAQLAPTALNQQRFHITYRCGAVTAKALPGPYTSLDLGIVKRHFELAAAPHTVDWS